MTAIDVIIAGLDPQVDIKVDQKKEMDHDKEKENPSTYVRKKSHQQLIYELLQKERREKDGKSTNEGG